MAPDASTVPLTATCSPRMVALPPCVVEEEATSMEPEFSAVPPSRPERSRVILPPAASPTSRVASAARRAASPPEEVMEPALETLPPMRAAKLLALIEPRLMTAASESPVNDILPERNAESAISRVEAIRREHLQLSPFQI